MSRPIARPRRCWWIPVLLLLSTAAVADEEWATPAADCLDTIDGFNEGREWAHYRITREEVRVLVQSDRDDWVFVELVCRPGGGLAEGPRRTLPQRVTGAGSLPPSMLARGDFSAERLERLAQRARQHAGLGRSVLVELDASYVHEPQPRTVYRAVLSHDGKQRGVEFDDRGVIHGQLALRPGELGDAPEPRAPGAALGLERLTDDPVKVLSYLAGSIGTGTRINRLIVAPTMLTVEWVSPDQGKILLNQWMIIQDNIVAPDDPTPPNIDKVCAKQPAVGAVKESLTRAMAQPARAKRVHQSMMLLLECDKAGAPPSWTVLGGDGKLEEGVALSQERFGF
jgi:hypothetical protein